MSTCTCTTGRHCSCYGNEQQYREERARQAAASRLEHAVLDLLRGKRAADAPRRAHELATLLAPHRAHLADLMTVDAGVYWWSHTGEQREALVDSRLVRLVA